MRNVEFEVKGTTLMIKVDLSTRLRSSKKGNLILATTEGVQKFAAGGKEYAIELNVFTKRSGS